MIYFPVDHIRTGSGRLQLVNSSVSYPVQVKESHLTDASIGVPQLYASTSQIPSFGNFQGKILKILKTLLRCKIHKSR